MDVTSELTRGRLNMALRRPELPLQKSLADEQIDIAVELAAMGRGRFRVPGSSGPRPSWTGVRRIESRLVITAGFHGVHRAIGSYGVGVVSVNDGRADRELHIGRVFDLRWWRTPGLRTLFGPGLTYEPISIAEDDPDPRSGDCAPEMRNARSGSRTHSRQATCSFSPTVP